MASLTHLARFLCLILSVLTQVNSLAFGRKSCGKVEPISQESPQIFEVDASATVSRRKLFLSSILPLSTVLASTIPPPASAKYVLNDDGDYDEVAEEDWQTVWKQRLDKANSMSTNEIFNAARGAGNLELKENESAASRKRRAMSACRDNDLRAKSGVKDAKECNKRVMDGDFDFILDK